MEKKEVKVEQQPSEIKIETLELEIENLKHQVQKEKEMKEMYDRLLITAEKEVIALKYIIDKMKYAYKSVSVEAFFNKITESATK